MAKGYEQVIEALRRVGSEHLEEARSCFLDHSNWLATAVNKAREDLLAIKALNSEHASGHEDQRNTSCLEGRKEQENSGARTRGRKRRGHQALSSIQEEDECSAHENKEQSHHAKRARSISDTGGAGDVSPLLSNTEPAAQSGLSDENPSKRRAPARRGRPPRAPRKGANDQDASEAKENGAFQAESQGSKEDSQLAIRDQATGNEQKAPRRTRRQAAGAKDRPEIPVAPSIGTRQTRSRAGAAGLENGTEMSGNIDNPTATTHKPRRRKRNARATESCTTHDLNEDQPAPAEIAAQPHTNLPQERVPEIGTDLSSCVPYEEVEEGMRQGSGGIAATDESDKGVLETCVPAADPQATDHIFCDPCDGVTESASGPESMLEKQSSLSRLPASENETGCGSGSDACLERAEQMDVKETEASKAPSHDDIENAAASAPNPLHDAEGHLSEASLSPVPSSLVDSGHKALCIMDEGVPAGSHEEPAPANLTPPTEYNFHGQRKSSLAHATDISTAVDHIPSHAGQQLSTASKISPTQELANALPPETAATSVKADSKDAPVQATLDDSPKEVKDCMQQEIGQSPGDTAEVKTSPPEPRFSGDPETVQSPRQTERPESLPQSSGIGSKSLGASEGEIDTRPSSTSLVASKLPTPETGGHGADGSAYAPESIGSALQSQMPVQTSRLGLGANLVSTVRSFLPFVTKNANDSTTRVAAGKTHVKVKALEAAEALKRKEAVKAAQRAKLKEEIEKQKAERNKVKREADKEIEIQRKKDNLMKKDEEAAARRKAKELAERKEREEKAKKMEQMRLKASHTVVTNCNISTQQAGGHNKQQYDREKSGNENDCANVRSFNNQGSGTSALAVSTGEGKPVNIVQSYEMSPYRSDSSDDDSCEDDRRRKPVPDWARGRALFGQLLSQAGVDPDEVFQQHSTTCPLDAVFGHTDPQGGKKKDLNRRGSSGNWIEDRVTWKEEMAYKRAMGYL
eukprot:jgi/Botrbrau1/19416/Bobra.0338s0043.1